MGTVRAENHGYALRHVDSDIAQEVLSETFLVAWWRLADVPDQPLPWLLAVADNTIANHRRSRLPPTALQQELVSRPPVPVTEVTGTGCHPQLAGIGARRPSSRPRPVAGSW